MTEITSRPTADGQPESSRLTIKGKGNNVLRNCKIVGHNFNSDVYHNQPIEKRGKPDYIMSPSALKLFRANASKWVDGYNPKESDAMAYGNLLDCLLLTPQLFNDRYIVIPATYKSKAMKCPNCGSITDSKKCAACKCERVEVEVEKEWNFNSDTCQKWLSDQKGKDCITLGFLKEAQLAVKKLMADETISDFVKCSKKQVHISGEWHDKKTGMIIPLQCLIDLVPDKESEFQKALADVKTCRNAEQEAFLWDAYKRGYHVQAAFDIDLYQMATRKQQDKPESGEDRVDWFFILSENEEPYAIGRRAMSADFIQIGRQTYQSALVSYARCLKTGVWPSYDPLGEFSMMIPYPKMEFQAIFEAMERQQAEAVEVPESDDIAP